MTRLKAVCAMAEYLQVVFCCAETRLAQFLEDFQVALINVRYLSNLSVYSFTRSRFSSGDNF